MPDEPRYGQNRTAKPLTLKHADLKYWNDESAFKKCCPACKEGVLLVYRNPDDLTKLMRTDMCVVCAQIVVYQDESINGEPFQDPYPTAWERIQNEPDF